jgi:hypothetical protein
MTSAEPTNSAEPVDVVAGKAVACIEKGEQAYDKAEEFYRAAGLHISECKRRKPDGVTWPEFCKAHLKVSSRRADELIAIGDGRKTLAGLRIKNAESKRLSRSRQRDVPLTPKAPHPAAPAPAPMPASAPTPARLSKVYSFGTGASRAARAAGLENAPLIAVTGGYQFELPPEPAPVLHPTDTDGQRPASIIAVEPDVTEAELYAARAEYTIVNGQPKAAQSDDDAEVEPIEDDPKRIYAVYMLRVAGCIDAAKSGYPGPVTEEIVAMARAVAAAWERLAQNLQEHERNAAANAERRAAA